MTGSRGARPDGPALPWLSSGARAPTRRALPPTVLAAQVVELVGDLCVAARVSGAGLLLLGSHDELRVVVATDTGAAALQRTQLDLRTGPSLDCVRSGRGMAVDDVTRGAWPELVLPLGRADVRAVVCMPVTASGSTAGSLDVFDSVPRLWSRSDIDIVQGFAHILGALLVVAAAPTRDPPARPSARWPSPGLED